MFIHEIGKEEFVSSLLWGLTINTTTRTKPHDVINPMNDTHIFVKMKEQDNKTPQKGRISYWKYH